MAQETSLRASTDRENSPLHLWEGRGPLLMADNEQTQVANYREKHA